MNDVQASKERRGIPLKQVGIRGLRYPIVFLDKVHRRHEAAATISMSVNLPHDQRGIHMSRLIEVLKDRDAKSSLEVEPGITGLASGSRARNDRPLKACAMRA